MEGCEIPLSFSSSVFLFPFYGGIETCCLDYPPIYEQSLFLVGYGLLFVVICCLLLLLLPFNLVAEVAVQIMLGNVVRVYPGTVQGFMFYHERVNMVFQRR